MFGEPPASAVRDVQVLALGGLLAEVSEGSTFLYFQPSWRYQAVHGEKIATKLLMMNTGTMTNITCTPTPPSPFTTRERLGFRRRKNLCKPCVLP